MDIQLPASNLSIPDCERQLLSFCDQEYAYYDAIPSGDPHRIDVIDVLATFAVNSRIGGADRIRAIHRGIATKCEPVLRHIPPEANLLEFDHELALARDLLDAACSVPWVLTAVATKILHRKRRAFMPMLDSVVIGFYLDALGLGKTKPLLQAKAKAADATLPALRAFREDLRGVADEINALGAKVEGLRYFLTPVRILEILVWTQTEPRGYYRNAIPVPSPDLPWGQDVIEFAMSYNGYVRHGDTDTAAEIGNDLLDRWRKTGRADADLPKLRCALFFEQRRAHHSDQPPDSQYLAALLAAIHQRSGGWVDGPADPPVW